MHIALRNLALLTVVVSAALPMVAQDTGAGIYKSNCAMCHGADGRGNTPMGQVVKAPPLQSSTIVNATDSDLIAATTNGKGKMAAYSGNFSDAQITQVIAYIRTLQK